MSRSVTLVFASASAILVGLGQPGRAEPSNASPSPHTQTQAVCPDVMRGLGLAVREINGGIEVDITTPKGERIRELRQQARAVATQLQTTATRMPTA